MSLVGVIRESYSRQRNIMVLIRLTRISYSSPPPSPSRWMVRGLCLHGLALWLGMVFGVGGWDMLVVVCIVLAGRLGLSSNQRTFLFYVPNRVPKYPIRPYLSTLPTQSHTRPPTPIHPNEHSDTTRYPLQRATAQTNGHVYVMRMFAISSWYFTSLFS